MSGRAAALAAALLALPASAGDFESCRAIEDAQERLACFDAIEPGQAGAAVPEPEELYPLESRIAGPFRAWKKGTLFTLDNGQVWKAVDDSPGYYPGIPDNPEITITETALGAHWMEVAGTGGRKIRVTRVK